LVRIWLSPEVSELARKIEQPPPRAKRAIQSAKIGDSLSLPVFGGAGWGSFFGSLRLRDLASSFPTSGRKKKARRREIGIDGTREVRAIVKALRHLASTYQQLTRGTGASNVACLFVSLLQAMVIPSQSFDGGCAPVRAFKLSETNR
jgi:hypothetical protein